MRTYMASNWDVVFLIVDLFIVGIVIFARIAKLLRSHANTNFTHFETSPHTYSKTFNINWLNVNELNLMEIELACKH